MTIISCPTKFWAFDLAEQLQRGEFLCELMTAFAGQKDPFKISSRLLGRIDNENIPSSKIRTHLRYAIKSKLKIADGIELNEEFDAWVATTIKRNKDYSVFIGWASISLQSIRQARSDGKVTVLERGSSHIQYQNGVLSEEYKKFGIDFAIDQRVIDKELREYDEVDYISIPSEFVKRSFEDFGVAASKLIVNNYGTSFSAKQKSKKEDGPLRIIYFGSLSVRKGLIYLMKALSKLNFPYEAWFVGKVEGTLNDTIKTYRSHSWKFIDAVPQQELPDLISQCDVFVLPSIEDGFAMVVAQALSCGVPAIVTSNVGACDIISEEENGFIVPPFDSRAIEAILERLHEDRLFLAQLKKNCFEKSFELSWDRYGDRYLSFLKSVK